VPDIKDIVKETRHRYYGWNSVPSFHTRRGRDHKYSDECWKIQFYGREACRFCSKDKDECSGRFILHTGRNELGRKIPFRRRTLYQAELDLFLQETPEETLKRLHLLIYDEIEARYQLVEDEVVEPFFECSECQDAVVISEWLTSEHFESARENTEGIIMKFCSERCRDQGSDHTMHCEGCNRELDEECFLWDDVLQESICEMCYSKEVFEKGTDEAYLIGNEVPTWPMSLSGTDLENRGFRPVGRYQNRQTNLGTDRWKRMIKLWTMMRERGLVAVFKEITNISNYYVSMYVKPMSKNRFRKNTRYKITG